MVKIVVIEDDEKSRQQLLALLDEHIKDVHVASACKNNHEAKAAILKYEPDLVISDIELEGEAVFTMLQELDNKNFEIIFTTGHDKYAIQAIKFSALYYILKPFGEEELLQAMQHYHARQQKKSAAQQLDALFYNFKQLQADQKKIVLPTIKGLEVFTIKEVIRCEAAINYTHFFMAGTKPAIVVTKTLKEYDELLGGYGFFRVHHSHLINLNHVKKYVKKDSTVIMSDGSIIDVSRRKKDEFLQRLEAL